MPSWAVELTDSLESGIENTLESGTTQEDGVENENEARGEQTDGITEKDYKEANDKAAEQEEDAGAQSVDKEALPNGDTPVNTATPSEARPSVNAATPSNAETAVNTDALLNEAAQDGAIHIEAKQYVCPSEKVTGDDNSCANMDPGVYLKIQADRRFNDAFYELQMLTCGNGREYEIWINEQKAGGYTVTGSGFGMDQIHEDEWQGRFQLKEGDELVIKAPEGSYGWIKDLLLRELPEKFYQKDPETGIVVETEDDLLPKGTELKVKQVRNKNMDAYFEEMELRAVYYEIQLKRPSRSAARLSEDLSTGMYIEIPMPPGFIMGDEATDIYYIHDGEAENLRGSWSDSGKGFRAAMELPENDKGVYALTTKKGLYHYEAEDFYAALTDSDKAANFETANGSKLEFTVEKNQGFTSGNYNLLVRYCGGGDSSLKVLVNDKPSGTIRLPYTDWESYRTGAAGAYLALKAGDRVAIEAPEGQYHWIDYLELKEAEPFYAEESGITVSAEVGVLPYGAQLAIEDGYVGSESDLVEQRIQGADGMSVFRLYFYMDDPDQPLNPAGLVNISMDYPAGFNPSKFCLYHVSGEGLGMKCVKIPSRLDGSELKFSLTRETGVFALVSGASYLPASYDSESIFMRIGGTKSNGENTGFKTQVRSRVEDGNYVYEGEAYYKAQGENPAADFQPGSQMNIPLSDNADFKSGTYRLVVRSNGNRQLFHVKVNHEQVGTISRFGTDFQMHAMTDDAMAETLALNPSDLLTIEAEGGENYGWVDYVALERLGDKRDIQEKSVAADRKQNKMSVAAATVTYRAADYYERKAEHGMCADLQPGESISFRVGDQPEFREGEYRIAVNSNGDRTRLLVKQNGNILGSIVRVKGNGFDRTDITRNLLNRNVLLKADDIITIEAPGSNPEEGPWGWVENIELVTPPASTGMAKVEYRYDGEDYYQASLYSPAADLQAGDSIHIPLSDDPDFQAGLYRLSVLSNGTREQFAIKVNGQPVGVIRKKAADYSDTDYSQDYMEGVISLSPGDILTLTGQDGDYFGWVNYILLEKEDA